MNTYSEIPNRFPNTIILNDYKKLLDFFHSESEIRSNFNILYSSIAEGETEYVVDMAKSIWKNSNKGVEEFLNKKFNDNRILILRQLLIFGINWWINETVKYDKFELKISKVINPSSGILKFIYKKGKYVPVFFLISPLGTKELKGAHFLIHDQPDFINNTFSSPMNTLIKDIENYRNLVDDIGKLSKEVPPFIIQEKYPHFKNMNEYILSLLYGFHKTGKTLHQKSTTFDDMDQSQLPCTNIGQGSINIGNSMEQLGLLKNIENNMGDLMKKNSYSGVAPFKIKLNEEKLNEKKYINTLKFGPFCEPIWYNKDMKTTERLNLFSTIKRESIKALFGRGRHMKTTIGSQMEAKATNYTIHTFKSKVEETLSKMIKTTIIDDKELKIDPKDEKIDTQINVFINTDDIIVQDILKLLITIFQDNPTILKYLVKGSSGIDVDEIMGNVDNLSENIEGENGNVGSENGKSPNLSNTLNKFKDDIEKDKNIEDSIKKRIFGLINKYLKKDDVSIKKKDSENKKRKREADDNEINPKSSKIQKKI